MENEQEKKHEFKLIVNKKDQEWPHQFIKGKEILQLAGSPADWVVNQLVPGGGADPEIAPEQDVDLDKHAPPEGVKKFQTRKPKTNPGQ